MRSLSSRIVPVATYGGEVSSTLSRKVLRLCGCALTMPCLLPRGANSFSPQFLTKLTSALGNAGREGDSKIAFTWGIAYGDDRVFLRDARLCVERAL